MPENALKVLSDEELTKLATLSIDAKRNAYCPYSNFRVGAAVLLTDGTYHTGANVEVASTPVGMCAERCAIAPIIASVSRPDMPVIRAIAVATDISPPASPCGMCRQFINEFATSRELPIYMYGKDGLEAKAVKMTIGELLPMSFGPNDMERNPGKEKNVGLGKLMDEQ